MQKASRACVVWLCLSMLLACDARPAADEGESAALSADTPRLSADGLYRVSLRPQQEPAPLRALHAWIARIETPGGEPVRLSRLAVSGGMPQHAHGFETEPRVTRDLGDGEFLIEGVRFHMSGEWQIRLEWVGPAGADVALFQIEVEP